MLVLSFVLLYQDRITAVLNVFALQAIALSLSVAWQSLIQDAPHLLVTAAIALLVKGIVIPAALHRIVRRLGIHREIEEVISAGPTMLTGLGLVALSILLVMPVGENVSVLVREDLAFALAVILLGLLMMITRRNAVTQIVGFMSLENGLVLAATGAKGMPLVVEFSRRILDPDRLHRVRCLRVSHPRTLRHRGRERARPVPRRTGRARMITPLNAILAIPAIAVLLLAIIPGYRIGAVLNMSGQRRSRSWPALRCCSSAIPQRYSHHRRFQHLSRHADHLRRVHDVDLQRQLYRS